jgi:hypothetical protein
VFGGLNLVMEVRGGNLSSPRLLPPTCTHQPPIPSDKYDVAGHSGQNCRAWGRTDKGGIDRGVG